MDIKIASSIAKNKAATSEELESVFGVDISIDRLLAKCNGLTNQDVS